MKKIEIGTAVIAFKANRTDYTKGVVTLVGDETYTIMTENGEVEYPHSHVSVTYVPMIVIQVEGGAVQNVLDYNDALEEVDVLIFDYDNMPEGD